MSFKNILFNKKFIHNTSLQSDATMHASYVVSGILARKKIKNPCIFWWKKV
jgi:hypothetical protein